MRDIDKYDSILYIENPILEMERVPGTGNWDASTKSMGPYPFTMIDPKMYSSFNFGRIIRNAILNMGPGYSAEVSDFKKWVVVRATYHNFETSRSATKTFLIVFQADNGDGIVLSTHNRYRTISGVDQASSYIRSACSTLKNSTQSKL